MKQCIMTQDGWLVNIHFGFLILLRIIAHAFARLIPMRAEMVSLPFGFFVVVLTLIAHSNAFGVQSNDVEVVSIRPGQLLAVVHGEDKWVVQILSMNVNPESVAFRAVAFEALGKDQVIDTVPVVASADSIFYGKRLWLGWSIERADGSSGLLYTVIHPKGISLPIGGAIYVLHEGKNLADLRNGLSANPPFSNAPTVAQRYIIGWQTNLRR